ncbi:Fatty-acid amide hydrolase 2-A [Armadillidium nasatum]|uniref:Fatty-acid amide hydrolase 2-A n=1 Tax=Armadillidium nasatum TaxID=96803 RepID=A0A5N5SLQ1_9CRUS|nr:Fatty-acid amide hydrolase 2-A [Armadillidium nasatum]
MNLLRSVLGFYIRLFWPILVIVRRVWDFWVSVLFRLTVGMRRRSALPPVFNPLLLLPATVLAENIRQRKMTSVDIVRAFVTRCSDVNPLLNSIVQENFQDALQTAKEIDERINEGYMNKTLTKEKLREEEPFLGVPFTVKETVSVQGFPHTAGLLKRSKERAEEDAVIVTRMKEAELIPMKGCNIQKSGEDKISIQVAGPLTRHAVDITPLLKILSGPKAKLLALDKPVHFSCLKFYYIEDDSNKVLTSDVIPALRSALIEINKYLLKKYDIVAMKVRIPDLRTSYWIWQEKMKEDYAANKPMYMELLNNEGEVNIWTEMLRGLLGGRARHSFASLLQVAIEKITDELRFLRDQKNVLEGKTVEKPLSYNPKWRQLKMKIQVVGGMYMDRLTIAVAKDLEKAFGGWKCPAKILRK